MKHKIYLLASFYKNCYEYALFPNYNSAAKEAQKQADGVYENYHRFNGYEDMPKGWGAMSDELENIGWEIIELDYDDERAIR